MARLPPKSVFKKGDPRINRTGLNRGHNKFETDFNVVCEQISKKNNVSFSEVRQSLLLKGYSEASKGSYQFWQYIHNQLYGTAPQTVDVTSDGEKIESFSQIALLAAEKAYEDNIPSTSKSPKIS